MPCTKETEKDQEITPVVTSLITVFDAIVTGRQSGQKLEFVWECNGKKLFQKLNFTQYENNILGGRLYSAWLKDAQLIFLTFAFLTFDCKFGWVDTVRGKQLWAVSKSITCNSWRLTG